MTTAEPKNRKETTRCANLPVNLILETDAIVAPLTGIGRYTLELLRAFQHSDDIADMRCVSRGQWQNPGKIIEEQTQLESAERVGIETSTSRRWTRNPAKSLARMLLPLLQQQALRKFSDSHIYHSPNYRLTAYPGRKIATFHDLSLFKYPEFHPEERRRVLIPAIEKAATTADHLITDSEQVRREIIEYFALDEGKVTAIHLASSLDPDSIAPQGRDLFLQQTGLIPGRYFLFVSTLEPRKNIEGLLAAFNRLPEQIRQNYPLVLAGQMGWNSTGIVKDLQRATESGQVLQPGFLSNRELCYLYSGSRAFVYPSIYEGFGLPVIEAQHFGIPVITSNRSCLPEVVGASGMLIDPEDPVEISEAMHQLVEDSNLHQRLSDAGKRNAQRFSWKNTAAETIKVYRALNTC